ncbi:PEPxxWA-CTERM sorting domain-containing protein [Erythrobacter sp. LQ02-29]|nr:PEPxxWA-CTERM sorting domain-containing protein [Erythrobacter sp. LQ02-29]MCP9222831.1 PEPxxWA-CTERM sorting domain-containing protein [Erythrobacter sp. LQ02-29]
MNKKSLFAATAAALLGTTSAHAAPIVWTLQGVTFTDGGTASGTFSTDSETGSLLSFDITTTAASALGGFTYDAMTSTVIAQNALGPNSFYIGNKATYNKPYLSLGFMSSLASVGTNVLDTARSYECDNCSPYRYVSAGSAIAASGGVPEPATWALLILGFGAIGGVMRRQGAKVARVRSSLSFS